MKKSDEFLKYVYEYCINAEYKRKELDLLAKKFETNRRQIRTWAKTYAKKNLTEDEYNKFLKKMDELTNRNTKLEMDSTNKILEQLTDKITDMLWENETEKKIVLEFIYNYCEKNMYNYKKIIELSNWSNIPKTKIELLAKEYATEYLGQSLEEYRQKRIQYSEENLKFSYKNRDSYSKIIYETLLKATTLEEIIEILNKSELSIETLKQQITNYATVHQNNNQKIIEELKAKIKMYTDYYYQIKQKFLKETNDKILEEKIPQAIDTITKFINDNECFKIDYFCYKYNIDKKTFIDYITIIKEHKSDLYKLYEKKINNIKKQKFAMISNKIKYIIICLNNGIEEYDVKRPFDIIDYYKTINIPLIDILKPAKEVLNSNELNLLRKFVNENIGSDINKPNDIKQIMSEKVIIKYEKDKKTRPIPGTEEYFSDTEKEKLINYLKENKIPINLKTYNTLYKRYRNGILDLNYSHKSK